MKKTRCVICIILILIVMLIFGYLTYYKYFKMDNEKGKNIDISDKIDDMNVIEPVEKRNKLLDISTATKEDFVKDAVIAFMEKEYNNFNSNAWKVYALYSLMPYTTEISRYGTFYDECNKKIVDETMEAMCMYNMDEEEFNKADKTLFEGLADGSITFESFDLDEMKKNVVKAYGMDGNMFDKTFKIDFSSCNIHTHQYDNGMSNHTFIYDSNLDRLFYRPNGACVGHNNRVVTDDKVIGNKYQVTYVEYYVDSSDDKLMVVSDGKELYEIKSYDVVEIDEHIDLFKKHTVEFEKANGIYKYVGEM